MHWSSLVRMSDSDLAAVDVAALNVACAEGLPGCAGIDRLAIKQRLDGWAAGCRRFTDAVLPQFRPDNPDGDTEAKFRVIAMVSHLQRDLGVKYNPRCIPAEAKFQPEDTFIHGITHGDGGSCASLPVLYAAVGRRLGYPIRLAATVSHLYCQWHGADGERFNIEGSGEGVNFFPDDHFRSGRFAMTAEQERASKFNTPRSQRENLADFLTQRGFLFREAGSHRRELESFAWANEVAPHIESKRTCVLAAMEAYDRWLRLRLPVWGFPRLDIGLPAQRFLNMPREIEKKWIGMIVTEDLLKDSVMDLKWWTPLLVKPRVAPPGLPAVSRIDFR